MPIPPERRASVILACAVAVLLLAMGVRATFGLFMQPMGMARDFGRDVFSMAFALQNLVWGAAAPFFGAFADKVGSGRAIAAGALLYAAGLVGTALATDPASLYLTAGLLVGLGQAGTTFGVVLGVVGRAVPAHRRSAALGLAAAGGSLGQFMLVPAGRFLIDAFDWQPAMLAMAALVLVMVPLAARLTGRPDVSASQANQRLADAFREAMKDRSYHLLFWSFWVCGFHTAFITLHLPSYVTDRGLSATHGAMAVATIGLFNVLGSWACGWLGGRGSKKGLLAAVYGLRAASILLLIALPMSPAVLFAFAATMGLLWLGTVPLTNGLVGQIYGLRYASTLYGLVFLGHQVGSFFGVWLGGRAYALTGSYDMVWWLGIGLALVAALLSWPIDERPLAGRAAADAPAAR